MTKYKVIFHIDEMNKWRLVLGNVSNLLNDICSEIMESCRKQDTGY